MISRQNVLTTAQRLLRESRFPDPKLTGWKNQSEKKQDCAKIISFIWPYLLYQDFSRPTACIADIRHHPIRCYTQQREERRIWNSDRISQEMFTQKSRDHTQREGNESCGTDQEVVRDASKLPPCNRFPCPWIRYPPIK